jgi:hypothetical protein
MIEALLHGHVATQVLAIRRLVDDGNSDIISLRRLVKDMRRNFALFTRENHVCFDGLPYDYEAVRHTRFMENAGNWGKGGIWVPTSGPQGDCISESAHRQFDQLAGIDPAKRSREGAERPNSRPAGDARSRNGTVQNSSRPCENSDAARVDLPCRRLIKSAEGVGRRQSGGEGAASRNSAGACAARFRCARRGLP